METTLDPAEVGPPWRRILIKTLVVGALAGAISGLFGVGGGVIIVPGLVYVAGMDQRLAHGTSLAAIGPIAAAALVGYALDAAVDWIVALFLVGGSVVGAYLGTHWLNRLPMRALQLGFAALLLVTALRLLLLAPEAPGRGAITPGVIIVLVVVGLVSGAVAGLFGVGGGIVMVPAMMILLGMPDVIAKGTSLAVILPTAVVGTLQNISNRNADLRAAGVVGAAGVVVAFLASLLALGLDPVLSQTLFAILLVVIAARMVLRGPVVTDA